MDGTCLTGYKFERGHPVVYLYYFYCTFIVVLSLPIPAETCSQISPNFNYYILFDVCCVLTVHNIL